MTLRKRIGSAALALVLAAMLFSTMASAQKDPPKLQIYDREPDLGTFYEGADIEYDFIVRNSGVAELHILGVRPG